MHVHVQYAQLFYMFHNYTRSNPYLIVTSYHIIENKLDELIQHLRKLNTNSASEIGKICSLLESLIPVIFEMHIQLKFSDNANDKKLEACTSEFSKPLSKLILFLKYPIITEIPIRIFKDNLLSSIKKIKEIVSKLQDISAFTSIGIELKKLLSIFKSNMHEEPQAKKSCPSLG